MPFSTTKTCWTASGTATTQTAGAADKKAYQAALETDVILLDDLGSHRVTDWVEDTVTAIINHRYNDRKALIVTTNLPDPELGQRDRGERRCVRAIQRQRHARRPHRIESPLAAL